MATVGTEEVQSSSKNQKSEVEDINFSNANIYNSKETSATAEMLQNTKNASDEDDDDSDMPPLEDRVPTSEDGKIKSDQKTDEGEGSSKVKDDGITSSSEEQRKTDPETLKENDVKDECFNHEDSGGKTEKNKEDEDEEKEEYLDILGNGLLKRKVIKEGETKTPRPIHGDIVTIKVSGQLEDGTVVDVQDSVTFTLGDGDVIQALDLGVALMNVGQIIEIITDARYAYGELGREPDIPSKATITYTVELLSKDYSKDIDSLTVTERLNTGEKKRERGNYLFSRCDYVGAINSYSKAVKIMDPESCSGSPEDLQLLLENRLKCYNNMAASQLKTGIFDAAKKSCTSVLDVQPDNVKALFRMGKACAGKGETREAVQYLKKAQRLEPDTKIINQELSKLSKRLNAETQHEKNMYQKMLGTKPTPTKSKKKQSSDSNKWVWPVAGAVAVCLLGVSITAYRHLHH